jgi:hypothetical protein
MDCGTHHYMRLMAEFGIVVDVFLSLDKASQDVIADITKNMGSGMAKFIEKEVTYPASLRHHTSALLESCIQTAVLTWLASVIGAFELPELPPPLPGTSLHASCRLTQHLSTITTATM